MKKIFLGLLFIFLSQSLQARYYDPDMGRFASRDPLQYIDGMNLYAGYFAQRFTVDPMGTKAHGSKPKDGYEYFKVPQEVIDKIKAVECVKLNMTWLDGTIKIDVPGADPIQSDLEDFFQNASNDECNVNMNIMHGLEWNEETKKYIKDNNTYPKENKNKCRAAKYGYYTCFNEQHNNMIPEDNRIPDLPKDPKKIYDTEITKRLKQNLPSLIKKLEEMCKCCDEVKVNIYLGRYYEKQKMEEDTKDADIKIPDPFVPPVIPD